MHLGENLSSLALGIRASQVRDCFSCLSQVLGRFKIVQISPDCIDWFRLYRLVVLRLSRLVVFRLSSAKSSGAATRSFPQIAAIRLASSSISHSFYRLLHLSTGFLKLLNQWLLVPFIPIPIPNPNYFPNFVKLI